ncbi:hypothetical protein M2323_003347 [Rhodoblastus acidophilus]|nr:hypothetical protein [Rhodoblastus acidophilus]
MMAEFNSSLARINPATSTVTSCRLFKKIEKFSFGHVGLCDGHISLNACRQRGCLSRIAGRAGAAAVTCP